MPNSRNLAFCKVVLHEKLLFGMYVIVAMFLSFFSGVGRKETYYGLPMAFVLKTCLLLT